MHLKMMRNNIRNYNHENKYGENQSIIERKK